MALQHLRPHQGPTVSYLHQPVLLYGSETWALTRALLDKVDAFDNICLRRILRIPYMDHVANAMVRLRAGSPPQLSQLIQRSRL